MQSDETKANVTEQRDTYHQTLSSTKNNEQFMFFSVQGSMLRWRIRKNENLLNCYSCLRFFIFKLALRVSLSEQSRQKYVFLR